ncbi:MAG: hypothetical protein MP439_09005 [Ferrimicrobium sp.]|nr:hypothetical protein [Ferrimicrobium sp.]
MNEWIHPQRAVRSQRFAKAPFWAAFGISPSTTLNYRQRRGVVEHRNEVVAAGVVQEISA